jgi:hypothetical protein
MNITKVKKLVVSYAFAFVSAVATLYLSGVTQPKDLLAAAGASVFAPVLRAMTPFDKSIGLTTWNWFKAWRSRKATKPVAAAKV